MKISKPKPMSAYKPKPAQNSGIFSYGVKGGKQKMDPAPDMSGGAGAARKAAFHSIKKNLGGS